MLAVIPWYLKAHDCVHVRMSCTVAGDGCVFIKVRAADTESLENFLMEILSLEAFVVSGFAKI